MQRKVFWVTFAILGLIADLALPFWWALVATIPIGFGSWWIAYRSDCSNADSDLPVGYEARRSHSN